MAIDQTMPVAATDLDGLRKAFGTFATGVTVVSVGDPLPHGMTANSFTSVSLDPPLVLVCVDRTAVMHERLLTTGAFGVSVLAEEQEEIARHFSDRRRPLGAAQFESVGWTPGQVTGVPLIDGALARFECAVGQVYDGGDHSIFTGRLLSADRNGADEPVLFLRGRFRRVVAEPIGVAP